jgi:signal transduction histidine kinase
MSAIPRQTYEQLYEMALQLAAVRQQDDTFQLIIDQAQHLASAKFASLFIIERGALVRVCASNKILYGISPRKNGTTESAFKNNQASLLHVNHIKKYHPQIKKLGISSDINIPLEYDGAVMGVLSVLSPAEKQFSPSDLDVLKFYGPLAALAIKNANYLQQLQSSLDSRDLFISIAAHELKTPITSLTLYTQHLQKKAQTTELGASIKKISTTLLRLSSLVNELLKIDQIKRGTLQFASKKCNLKAPVTQAITEFSLAFPQHSITFSCNTQHEPIIKGDSDKILQAILNILTNAGKFCPPEKGVTVTIRERQDNWAIEITDKGDGIPAELHASIFERFFKVAKPTPSPGMGLGLYLVKHIIERHGGEVRVTSQEKIGTTFTLLLPKYHAKLRN